LCTFLPLGDASVCSEKIADQEGEVVLCVGISHSKSVVTVQRAFRAKCSSPPLPRDLADLKARNIVAVKNIYAPVLTRVWQELEYRIDVCRVTGGAHIEQLQLSKKISFPVAVKNSIKVGPSVFFL